jgi:hypothetical protein
VRARACVSISVQQRAERAHTGRVLPRIDALLKLDDLDAVIVHASAGVVLWIRVEMVFVFHAGVRACWLRRKPVRKVAVSARERVGRMWGEAERDTERCADIDVAVQGYFIRHEAQRIEHARRSPKVSVSARKDGMEVGHEGKLTKPPHASES